MGTGNGLGRPQQRDTRIAVFLGLSTLLPVAFQTLLPLSLAWLVVALQLVALGTVLIIFNRQGALRWPFIVALLAAPLAGYTLARLAA